MADNTSLSGEQKFEFELAIRDSASQALVAIANHLAAINKNVGKSGGGGADERQSTLGDGVETLKKLHEHSKIITEAAKQGTRSLLGFGDMITKIGGMLAVSPMTFLTAVAAGTYAVAKAMDVVITKRLQIRELSRDTGFSEGRISILERFGTRMGFSPESIQKNIQSLGKVVMDIKSSRGGLGTEAEARLRDVGENKYATEMIKEINGGSNADQILDKAAAHYAELVKAGQLEQAAKFADAMKLDQSFLKDYKENTKDLTPVFLGNAEAAQEWAKRMIPVWESFATLGEVAVAVAIETLYAGGKWFEGSVFGSDYIDRPSIRDPLARIHARLQPVTAEQWAKYDAKLAEAAKNKKESAGYIQDILNYFRHLNETGYQKPVEGKAEGGWVGRDRVYHVGERGPELLISGGSARGIGVGGQETLRPTTAGMVVPNQGNFQPPGLPTPQLYRGAGEIAFGGFARQLGAAGAGRGDRATLDEGVAATDWASGLAKMLAAPTSYRPEDAALLATAIGYDKSTTDLRASVTFNNVPAGVSTTANAKGLDQFRMNRSQQLASR